MALRLRVSRAKPAQRPTVLSALRGPHAIALREWNATLNDVASQTTSLRRARLGVAGATSILSAQQRIDGRSVSQRGGPPQPWGLTLSLAAGLVARAARRHPRPSFRWCTPPRAQQSAER